jgi:hypothetical protein
MPTAARGRANAMVETSISPGDIARAVEEKRRRER